MKRIATLFVALIIVLSACSAPGGYIEARPGDEFTLSVGQAASIVGENVLIKFESVVEDSRCPRDVVCIWAGRVSCELQITSGGAQNVIQITQMGLTDQSGILDYGPYRFSATVEPYPIAGYKIGASEYRLHLRVNRSTRP